MWCLRRWSRRARDESEEPLDPELLARVRAEAGAGEFPETPTGNPPDDERTRIYQDLRELDFDRQAGKLSEADYESSGNATNVGPCADSRKSVKTRRRRHRSAR